MKKTNIFVLGLSSVLLLAACKPASITVQEAVARIAEIQQRLASQYVAVPGEVTLTEDSYEKVEGNVPGVMAGETKEVNVQAFSATDLYFYTSEETDTNGFKTIEESWNYFDRATSRLITATADATGRYYQAVQVPPQGMVQIQQQFAEMAKAAMVSTTSSYLGKISAFATAKLVPTMTTSQIPGMKVDRNDYNFYSDGNGSIGGEYDMSATVEMATYGMSMKGETEKYEYYEITDYVLSCYEVRERNVEESNGQSMTMESESKGTVDLSCDVKYPDLNTFMPRM